MQVEGEFNWLLRFYERFKQKSAFLHKLLLTSWKLVLAMLHLKILNNLLPLLVSFSICFNFVLIYTIKDLAQNLGVWLYKVVYVVVECSTLLFGRCPQFIYSNLHGLKAPNQQRTGPGNNAAMTLQRTHGKQLKSYCFSLTENFFNREFYLELFWKTVVLNRCARMLTLHQFKRDLKLSSICKSI